MNVTPVVPHGGDRGQCLSFQVEPEQKWPHMSRDEAHIDTRDQANGAGLTKTQFHSDGWSFKKCLYLTLKTLALIFKYS